MSDYKMICCVVNPEGAAKTLKSARKHGIHGGTIMRATGTVSNKVLEFFGIDEIKREIVIMLTGSGTASETIRLISEDMDFRKPNHGIAFLLPVDNFIGNAQITCVGEDNDRMNENVYQIIYVIVDRGKSESVVEAANKAGVKGGTVIKARGAGDKEAQKLFSIEIAPEKAEVFFIVKKEYTALIVESIRNEMKIDEPGNGIMFVMNIDEVYGLHDK